MDWQAPDADHATRVRESFALQGAMQTLGARLETIEPGLVTISMPFAKAFTQQDGFMHAGALTTVTDSACGYAALSLMPADCGVLTVEFKMNLLAPAKGPAFVCEGRVVKAGKTLMFCEGTARVDGERQSRTLATMSATMMVMPRRDREDG